MKTEDKDSAVEWTKEYDYSKSFLSASFDPASGLYPVVSVERQAVVSVFGLGGSAGKIVEVFAWNGSTFSRVGHWGGNSARQVYRVEALRAQDRAVVGLALHVRENGQLTMPTIYGWNGMAHDGKFAEVNEEHPDYYRALVDREMSNLRKHSEWWPDSFVQVLSRVVEGDVYRKAYDEAVKVCRETLPRIETESTPAPQITDAAPDSAKQQSAAKLERDKARAKADVHLLVGAIQEIAGKKQEARKAFSKAGLADQDEYNYQIGRVRRFVRTRLGAPLLSRID
ncbi:MAG TPA: hypothetical protein VNS63_00590 [Blastocatellia bacterium]|nr:hypothetical protein [Blastocatellia bacterium]